MPMNSVELGGMRTLAAELGMLEAKVQSEVMRQWVRETTRLVGRVLAARTQGGQQERMAAVSMMLQAAPP